MDLVTFGHMRKVLKSIELAQIHKMSTIKLPISGPLLQTDLYVFK